MPLALAYQPGFIRCRIHFGVLKTLMPNQNMASYSVSPDPQEETPNILDAASSQATPSRHHMSARNRFLFFLVAWLIVLMPFLFWWSTWFGRHLSDTQISEYLSDAEHPRHIQHALVQLGERMERHDAGAARWYPEMVRLSSNPVEEVRNTDAWLMGLDTSYAPFHPDLLNMLQDSSTLVRGNAALSLVRFGDAAGRPYIVALLQPAKIVAPVAGLVVDVDRAGTSVRQAGLIAKLQLGQTITDVRSPIAGRIHAVSIAKGTNVAAGAEIASVDPGVEQIWEALRALYLIGEPEDLPLIRTYERESPELPDRIRQQALLTEKAIRDRAATYP